ncbi:MAG: sodium:calcium antiporter [Thermodesulfovibrio sp.]|uniref:sodium:calcium antiporter n=1 Tax=unclassified Thermodesulfovibrio TaxID=2645936 RepID=UPI00083B0FE3|nr:MULTISPECIES: sodium:calcium antiporter [unclassified Thermodesulfovibrio]MDI1471951.1 sodium:calcium antiporter [Thermodesulfovibrio sp. 1176]MDI6714976.1 sodium:calcium antiporter [Thermodesulfovibrio sp.]ODA44254.1 Sodium/calcium exchanger membrane region [Thermodesulfovibrio sp. N1]
MTEDIFLLIFNLLLILLSAEVFTNGVEVFGKRLSLSQAVTGSILAAVGTALPETILPMVAIFLHKGESAHSIGIGAILGAPFMLATLAFLMIGLTVLIAHIFKRRAFTFEVENTTVKRDLMFFLVMYSSGIFLPMFIKQHIIVAFLLVFGYIAYLYVTFKSESSEILHEEKLYLEKIFGKIVPISRFKTFFSLIQVLLALGIMIKGAHGFVSSLQHLSIQFGFDPLLFALLVAPVATELPEKFNSATWTFRGRDTLAMGNVTGAMVFQSTFPVSVGIIFTEWNITGYALLSACLAILAGLIVLGEIFIRKKISPLTLIFSGSFYLLYSVLVILSF